MKCPECGHNQPQRNGVRMSRLGKIQSWHCPQCGRNWGEALKGVGKKSST